MKIGIFYSSNTGTTAEVANKIAKAMNVEAEDVHNIAHTMPSAVGKYDMIVLGSPTYGSGELQDDWYGFLDALTAMDLRGKYAAVFGTGDQGMSHTFCDAVGIIYDRMKATGANMVGGFNTFPYEFDSSKAVPVEGAGAVGLLIDVRNHKDAADRRIGEWATELAASAKVV